MYTIFKNRMLLAGMGILPIIPTASCMAQKSERPNVIFILADDLGIGDLSCYGQQKFSTPAIDALAARGLRFTHHYSGSTVSAPSRCSLMTGLHTGHTFIRGNKGYTAPDGRMYDLNIPDSTVTLGKIFKEAGYATACCGKWGLGGPGAEGRPNKQGFDYFFGYLGQGNAHKYYPSQLFENDTPVMLHNKVYSYDLIIDKTLKFIDQHADEPFFLFMTPTIPHAELIVPEADCMGFAGKFEEVPFAGAGSYCAQPRPRATFAAMVTRLDRDVQRVVDLLKEKGIADNTIIIFTSDNGTHKEGGHTPDFFNSNGGFRGYKRDLYEGGIRTPFIVCWPKVIKKAKVVRLVSTFWDFMPTVCDLTGVKHPAKCDGISYLPTLTGKGHQKKHDTLYYEFHEQGGKQCVIKGDWKLIRLNVNKPMQTREELYNLRRDVAEKSNLISKYPRRVAALRAIMERSRTSNPNWEFASEEK